jgi:hypothetical protein
MDLELWVGNLLARIFRDGGHHHAAVGTEQACKEAEAILADCIVSGTLDLSHQKRILQGENAALRQALEFYANPQNYETYTKETPGAWGGCYYCPTLPVQEEDRGEKARQALATDARAKEAAVIEAAKHYATMDRTERVPTLIALENIQKSVKSLLEEK